MYSTVARPILVPVSARFRSMPSGAHPGSAHTGARFSSFSPCLHTPSIPHHTDAPYVSVSKRTLTTLSFPFHHKTETTKGADANPLPHAALAIFQGGDRAVDGKIAVLINQSRDRRVVHVEPPDLRVHGGKELLDAPT